MGDGDVVRDDLGEVRFVYCDACRSIAVEPWDRRRRRRNWAIAHLDPKRARTLLLI